MLLYHLIISFNKNQFGSTWLELLCATAHWVAAKYRALLLPAVPPSIGQVRARLKNNKNKKDIG